MRRLILAGMWLGAACASMAPPPGGPEDRDPPRVLARMPDSTGVDSTSRAITIQFNEVIAEPPRTGRGGGSGLSQFVLISPEPESFDVEWRRDRIVIEPEGGLRRDVIYRVTLLPGITDLRGQATTAAVSWTFATGRAVAPYFVQGRIFDWAAETPAPIAIVRAVRRISATDSLVYVGASDSTGTFTVGPLAEGAYEVSGFIDVNRNRRRDSTEKWSGIQAVSMVSGIPPFELLAIERDTMPPEIANAEVLDSVSIRIRFDRAIDPQQFLQPALVRVQRTDSSEMQVVEVISEAQDAQRRVAIQLRIADSINQARIDSLRRAGVAVPATPPAPPPAAATPPIKPSRPAPSTAIVIRLSPLAQVAPDEIVRVTTRGFRGLLGASKTATTSVRRGSR